MAITVHEAFKRATEAFKLPNIDGFAEVLSDNVAFQGVGWPARRGKGGLR
jgi:hypothetical protein